MSSVKDNNNNKHAWIVVCVWPAKPLGPSRAGLGYKISPLKFIATIIIIVRPALIVHSERCFRFVVWLFWFCFSRDLFFVFLFLFPVATLPAAVTQRLATLRLSSRLFRLRSENAIKRPQKKICQRSLLMMLTS